MIKPPYARLHYRSSFELEQVSNHTDDLWNRTVTEVWQWIKSRIVKSGFGDISGLNYEWFRTGGEWTDSNGISTIVETDVLCIEKEPEGVPSRWALRFVHPCRQVHQRWWQTDVCIQRVTESCCRVSVLNYHWIREGFVGVDPVPPVPTSPTLVRNLLKMSSVIASHGNVIVNCDPREIDDLKMEEFRNALLNPNRGCPVVYCSLAHNSSKPPINTKRLAIALAGNAIVRSPADAVSAVGFQKMMPSKLFVNEGMIRVFMPNIPSKIDSSEALRHRYFGHRAIEDLGEEGMIDLLAASLARRYSYSPSESIYTIDGIRREKARQELRSKIDGMLPDDRPEWIEEIEDEMDKLAEKNSSLESERDSLQVEIESLNDQLRSNSFVLESVSYGKNVEGPSDLSTVTSSVCKYGIPFSTLEEVLEFSRTAYGDRLHVCEEALKSAGEASVSRNSVFTSAATRMLCSLATVYFDLVNGRVDYSGTLESAFIDQTGLTFAMRENKQTKKDASIMKLRKRFVDGVEIDIVPHLKFDKNKDFLRIHFGTIEVKEGYKKIVIGHCGDHLPTSGSIKRS